MSPAFALFSDADLFVIPSRLENLLNTGLEAHGCGTSLVAFNNCVLSHILEERLTFVPAVLFDEASVVAVFRCVFED